MSQQVLDQYRALVAKLAENAETCFAVEKSRATFLRCHNFLTDLGILDRLTEKRPENYCVARAASEYRFALSALLSGHYRHSFASLRLTAELLLYGVFFSAHEVKLRQWRAGHRDLTWQRLNDDDKGIFSAPFVRAFSPTLCDLRKKYGAIAVTSYRECSEFVHGNPVKTEILKDGLDFDEAVLNRWEGAMQALRLSILFAYIYRYTESLGSDAKTLLEPIFLSDFQHEEEVRQVFK